MEAEEYSFSISPPTHHIPPHPTIIPHIFCGNNGTCSLSFDEISVGYNASFSFSEHNESPVPAISVFFPCRRHHCFFFLFFLVRNYLSSSLRFPSLFEKKTESKCKQSCKFLQIRFPLLLSKYGGHENQ